MQGMEEDELQRDELEIPSDLDEEADNAYGMEDDEDGEEEGEEEAGIFPPDNEGSFPEFEEEDNNTKADAKKEK